MHNGFHDYMYDLYIRVYDLYIGVCFHPEAHLLLGCSTYSVHISGIIDESRILTP